jgi:uncharacterized protein YjiK
MTSRINILGKVSLFSLILSLLTSCAPFAKEEASPLDILFPYQKVKDIDPIDFPEPSGIVFHPLRGTLFVVGDEGDIAEIHPDGSLRNQGQLEQKDFEGITVDPSTGLLYVVTESKAKIFEIDPERFNTIREITIDPSFEDEKIIATEKNHVEAITFVPNTDPASAGTFFLANQNPKSDNEFTTTVLQIQIPLNNTSGEEITAQIINHFSLNVPDLSELYYDPLNDHLYAISDQTNTFFEITKDGLVLKSYALPGNDQEGITLDNQGFLYIAQDSGGIIKYVAQLK